ncbi:ankyrin repeat domain-containing protein EMB506, chloroplastic [Neltuma alba]|uniref:ankyrin repeat domain-containing protein EMB506, chloroplastic n=1 Tax=Neltuma alba TaxID=207710 RepID=UPI0010A2E826|nr:ankyrin repeat domain-containing protein EMB506, chloroplastic-like [Prosopis alba]XP_028790516.1 ankyrin repeat domain-containing protein EMB506, chloroplastic-like [Prosopis alba]XP_028790517.1 ankyrin repeat domain-containing protein EMB506, chloroplastic-like [Prosopis alba]XP_028790518.1 ankyrin repeat domain-containing protein EMB506, chloroplastic-like [Prosopis alba]
MSYWSPASVFSNHPIPLSPASTISYVTIISGTGFMCSRSQGRCYLSVSDNHCKIRRLGISGVLKSRQGLTDFQAQQGTWEEPDDGSGSEYDEEEDEQTEDENYGFESDWEEEEITSSAVNGVSSVDNCEEDFKKEVEQLLEPEERAVLQQNVTPNLEKISTEKWSPMHTLALSTQIKCMDQLLENGVGIDLKNKEGLTALHIAIIGKKEAVISHLLRKGASPHVKDKDGATPLHYAVQVGAKQTVKLLIKYKVDVNVADNEGWTPLHVAIQSRNRDIAKILLVNGADKTRRNKDGKTALDLSLCYGKDFKSYDLGKLLKVVPADTDF